VSPTLSYEEYQSRWEVCGLSRKTGLASYWLERVSSRRNFLGETFRVIQARQHGKVMTFTLGCGENPLGVSKYETIYPAYLTFRRPLDVIRPQSCSQAQNRVHRSSPPGGFCSFPSSNLCEISSTLSGCRASLRERPVGQKNLSGGPPLLTIISWVNYLLKRYLHTRSNPCTD